MTLLAKNLRSQVDAPGLHLQDIPDAASNPFGLVLPPPSGFSFRPRNVRRTLPVFRCQHRKPSSVTRFSLPFGTSRSLQIVALSQRLGLRSLPWCTARFSFAPRKRQSPFNNYPLSDHRSRFATVHQAAEKIVPGQYPPPGMAEARKGEELHAQSLRSPPSPREGLRQSAKGPDASSRGPSAPPCRVPDPGSRAAVRCQRS
jgi:hypothetical protein